MKPYEIREQRALKVAEMRSLADGEMSPEKKSRFDALKQEVVALEQDEQRALFLEEAERRSMAGAADRPFNDLQSEVSVVEVIRNAMEGRNQTGAAAEYAKEVELRTGRKAQGVFIPMGALETRVAAPIDTTAGADLVPTNHRADLYIQPLRDKLLARSLGVQVLGGLTGNVSIPKAGTGTSVGWVAEGGNLALTDMTFDSVTLAPKHAGGYVEMSRQLIQQGSPDIERLVRGDLAAVVAKAIDSALIGGGGTNEPVGILANLAASGGVQTSSLSTLSWAKILELLQKLDIENVSASAIIASTKVKAKLAGTVKAANTATYLMENGRVADLAAYFSNNVPEKTGTPNTGRLIAGDFSQAMLGIWSEIDLLVNPYEAAAFKRGGVLVRAMSTVDVALRNPEAFVVADDIAI